ncbi:MAG: UDP-N-acetylglucosamine--LPS N-acetylglucosamine transferase [Geminicoccaceae bacterium]
MRPLWTETRRTCWAYSPGGHLAELERATAGIRFADRFDVTFAGGRPPQEAPRRVYLVCHPRRSVVRTLRNAARSLLNVLRERPRLVISTGADVAVAVCILARLLGARLVFIETAGELAPTLAGRLVYPFADLFVVQWPDKADSFPRAVVASGPLL